MTVLRRLSKYEFGKRNPLYQIRNFFCFNNNISNLYNNNIMIYNKKVRKNSIVCDCLPTLSITTLVKLLSLFIKM